MISYEAETKSFHLTNRRLSCVLMLNQEEDGETLIMSYLGAPLSAVRGKQLAEDLNEQESSDSQRDRLPYACPTEGSGDYRPVSLRVRDGAGQRCTELFYQSHRIQPGKPKLAGLPATYVESRSEAETLCVALRDPLTGLKAELSYTIFAEHGALAASAVYHNDGDAPLTLEGAASFCLTLPGRYDLLHLPGAWARERHAERVPPACLTRMLESSRGASGHEHNPLAVLMEPGADEHQGECYGVNLVYSGDFRISVDENNYVSTRLVAGLNPRTLEWRLAPGESFQAPEAVCVYSAHGLNGMSQSYHKLYRTRLCRGYWRDKDRPILINNWEATYFNFDKEKLLRIARKSAELGVELFVLDDGWFGHRDSDNCSLGDWVADRRKLPDGIEGIAKAVNALGMKFGLWVEPEMVSPDSDLYRAHPDWCLHADGRRRTQARNQLVLDMSREDVQQYVLDAISNVLRSAPISYIKWDMNRNFKEAGSALLMDGRQGELSHRYMLGLYRVLEKLTADFPQVLFESCASGGGRFDPGMLYYMPQTWTSDDTDAMERLYIQHGTSLCYPPSAMGTHVSASPNHQVQRVTSMRTRGDVALGGSFGYELDLAAQTPEDTEEIRRQIHMVKALRSTVRQGVFTRLLNPAEGNVTAWQFVDENRAILCVYRMLAKPNPSPIRVRMRGLEPSACYRSEDGRVYGGDELMHIGVYPQLPEGDFASAVIVLTKN